MNSAYFGILGSSGHDLGNSSSTFGIRSNSESSSRGCRVHCRTWHMSTWSLISHRKPLGSFKQRSFKGDIEPYRSAMLGNLDSIFGGSWDSGTTCIWACNPTDNLPNWPYYLAHTCTKHRGTAACKACLRVQST